MVVAPAPQPPARPDQHRGEDEAQPAERVERGGTGHDEDRPQHQREQDPVGQQPVALLRGHRERGEDEQEHEDVVERERLLDQVPGQEGLSVPGRGREQQNDEEDRGRAHPEDARDARVVQAHLAPAAADDGQVEHEQERERAAQDQPGGERAGHAAPCSGSRTARISPT